MTTIYREADAEPAAGDFSDQGFAVLKFGEVHRGAKVERDVRDKPGRST